MKLLTKEIRDKLPKLYANDNKKPEDVKIIVKFFSPVGSWTWYATEGEKQENGDYLFFGFVAGDFPDLGYFSLKELESVKLPFGLGIERDLHYGYNHTLAEVMEKVGV